MKDNGNNKDDYIIENQEHFDKTVKALLKVKPRKEKASGNRQPLTNSVKAVKATKSE